MVFDSEAHVACVVGKSGLFLPGGGIECGDDADATLHREVREECAGEVELVSSLPSAIRFFSTLIGKATGFELPSSSAVSARKLPSLPSTR